MQTAPASKIRIAVPAMPTPVRSETPAGDTASLGLKVAEIVAADLSGSGLFAPRGPAGLQPISMVQVTAPDFRLWGEGGSTALVQGFVQSNANGSLTVGCYLYDITAKTEIARQGFVVQPAQWRRGAHKCADSVLARISGQGGHFDSRLVYISETGPAGRRTKRLAIMDQDGSNHRFLTNGQSVVLTPRLSPDQRSIAYMSYIDGRPRAYLYDLDSAAQRPVVDRPEASFAPRFSPDGRWLLFSMSVNGNVDLYRVAASGGEAERLTAAPGIDTGGSFSPDGSKIVFESDRGGSQQLYVMDRDGSNQRRISFGQGAYGAAEWSPAGDMIAFVRTGADGSRIGIFAADGSGEKMVIGPGRNEAPSWSPNGRLIAFSRGDKGLPNSQIWTVDIATGGQRQLSTPLDGSDPFWSSLLQ